MPCMAKRKPKSDASARRGRADYKTTQLRAAVAAVQAVLDRMNGTLEEAESIGIKTLFCEADGFKDVLTRLEGIEGSINRAWNRVKPRPI